MLFPTHYPSVIFAIKRGNPIAPMSNTTALLTILDAERGFICQVWAQLVNVPIWVPTRVVWKHIVCRVNVTWANISNNWRFPTLRTGSTRFWWYRLNMHIDQSPCYRNSEIRRLALHVEGFFMAWNAAWIERGEVCLPLPVANVHNSCYVGRLDEEKEFGLNEQSTVSLS